MAYRADCHLFPTSLTQTTAWVSPYYIPRTSCIYIDECLRLEFPLQSKGEKPVQMNAVWGCSHCNGFEYPILILLMWIHQGRHGLPLKYCGTSWRLEPFADPKVNRQPKTAGPSEADNSSKSHMIQQSCCITSAIYSMILEGIGRTIGIPSDARNTRRSLRKSSSTASSSAWWIWPQYSPWPSACWRPKRREVRETSRKKSPFFLWVGYPVGSDFCWIW